MSQVTKYNNHLFNYKYFRNSLIKTYNLFLKVKVKVKVKDKDNKWQHKQILKRTMM